ncbi:MAG: endopeptidase La [Chloroflexi bacterium]|nr:endopeptidase La [Chloroflexota bacterium]
MSLSQIPDSPAYQEELQDESRDREAADLETVSILPLRNTVVFPTNVLPLVVERPGSIQLIDDALVGDRLVLLVALKNPEVEDPTPEDLYEVGVLAVVHRMARDKEGSVLRLIVQGLDRVRITGFTQTEPYMRGTFVRIAESAEEDVVLEALSRSLKDLFHRVAELTAYFSDEMVEAVLETEQPARLAYQVAASTRMTLQARQALLELEDTSELLRRLIEVLTREVDILELGQKIRNDAQSEIGDMQRRYFLQEQLKAIQRELGEDSEQVVEARELAERIAAADMPEEAAREANRELDRLSKLPAAAAEYSVIRTYLDWLISLPWNTATEDNLDVNTARQVLDEDHYGLKEIKDRIVEYLAVRKLREERSEERDDEEPRDLIRREREGVILCLVGPPGVGKTSLGQSIARALGRKFIRQSLGGVHDEAEIRGHRRTYIGAMPGRIVQAIRRCGSRNPVFMLDEIDKVGSDFRGDPTSALLEVLDPEQNTEFRDHYLGVPFDLSEVMFITTANMLDTIPGPLLDRMEVLQLSGYTEHEKLAIARSYLVPRQVRENGLREGEILFEDAALARLVNEYTREAGVRNLERMVGAVCRKVAARVAAGEGGGTIIRAEDIPDYLGKQRYYYEVAERTQMPGVATGLAWTQAGGDILFIEATRMKGQKGFVMTGQLGQVMQESAQAALSYVRANAADLGVDPELFDRLDIHLHVPAGAIPKDGPSAGVAMATALASLVSGRPVHGDVAMTGEITLRGLVLPVGGIKEKVLAAHRAGIRRVCLPRRNEYDLDDLPEQVLQELDIILVDRVEQVLAAALDTEGHNSGKKAEQEGADPG